MISFAEAARNVVKVYQKNKSFEESLKEISKVGVGELSGEIASRGASPHTAKLASNIVSLSTPIIKTVALASGLDTPQLVNLFGGTLSSGANEGISGAVSYSFQNLS